MRVHWIDDAVYELAESFKTGCLLADGSLLTPGLAVHSAETYARLREAIEDVEDRSNRTFITKLLDQVSNLPDPCIQATAELLVIQLLGEDETGGAKKVEHVEALLELMDQPATLTDGVRDALDGGGVARYGVGKNRRDHYLRFLVKAVRRIKELDDADRGVLFGDAWRFQEFVVADRTPMNAMQANAFLYLMFPETFSTVISGRHRTFLLETFAHAPGVADAPDDDRRIARIQRLVDEQLGYEVGFYTDPLVEIWNGEADERSEELIEWATRLHAHHHFHEYEYDYKLRLAELLAPLPDAVVSDDFLERLRAALTTKDNNLTAWQVTQPFLDWCASDPDDAAAALRSLWGDEDWEQALDDFIQAMPTGVAGGIGGRLSLASLLWLAVDPVHTPPFRWEVYTQSLAILGREPAPTVDPDDARSHVVRVFEQWSALVEEVQLRMLGRGIALHGALDGQGLMYAIVKWDPPPEWDEASRDAFVRFRAGDAAVPAPPSAPGPTETRLPPGTPELADALNLPLVWVQETIDLLAERRQLIFYGPPGTGKTYIARHLGRHIAGDAFALRLVQFHPSYTYEDFFEGYRPLSEQGQLTYQLTHGPLRLLAEQAAQRPGVPHVLIIDEINRGNVSKIFGELYFLLEYRDQAIRLQYSPTEDFSLPPNLYVIGTMNTADRSIALVDSALRRRFYFRDLMPTRPPVDQVLRTWLTKRALDLEPADVLDELNRAIDDEEISIGPSYLMSQDGRPPQLEHAWEHSILPLLEEHFYAQRREVRARFGLQALQARLDAQATAEDDAPDDAADDQGLGA